MDHCLIHRKCHLCAVCCGSKLTLSITFCRAGALDEGIRHRDIVGICEHDCVGSAACTIALEVRAPMPLETPHGTDGEQVHSAIPSSSYAPSQMPTMYSSATAPSAYCACRWRVSNDWVQRCRSQPADQQIAESHSICRTCHRAATSASHAMASQMRRSRLQFKACWPI